MATFNSCVALPQSDICFLNANVDADLISVVVGDIQTSTPVPSIVFTVLLLLASEHGHRNS